MRPLRGVETKAGLGASGVGGIYSEVPALPTTPITTGLGRRLLNTPVHRPRSLPPGVAIQPRTGPPAHLPGLGAAWLAPLLPGRTPRPVQHAGCHAPAAGPAPQDRLRAQRAACASVPGGARALAAPTPLQPGAVGRGGRLPAPRGAARGPGRQPRVRAGGPGPSLPALGPGPAPLLRDAVLPPGPGARPGAAARGLPRRLLGRPPAAAAAAAAPGRRPPRALQLPPAPGLQRLGAVPALPAEPLPPPPGSPPDARASHAAAAFAVSASGRGVRGRRQRRRQRREPGSRRPPPAHADAAHRGHRAAAAPAATQGRPRPSRAPRASRPGPGGPGARARGGAGVGRLRAGRCAGRRARPRLCAFSAPSPRPGPEGLAQRPPAQEAPVSRLLAARDGPRTGRPAWGPLLRSARGAPPQGWRRQPRPRTRPTRTGPAAADLGPAP